MGPKKGPQKWTQKLAPKVDRKAQVFRILVAVFWRHVCSKSDRVLGLGRLARPTSSTAYFGYSAGASPAKPVSAVQPAAGRAKRSSSPRSLPFSKQQAGQAGTLLTLRGTLVSFPSLLVNLALNFRPRQSIAFACSCYQHVRQCAPVSNITLPMDFGQCSYHACIPCRKRLVPRPSANKLLQLMRSSSGAFNIYAFRQSCFQAVVTSLPSGKVAFKQW